MEATYISRLVEKRCLSEVGKVAEWEIGAIQRPCKVIFFSPPSATLSAATTLKVLIGSQGLIISDPTDCHAILSPDGLAPRLFFSTATVPLLQWNRVDTIQ